MFFEVYSIKFYKAFNVLFPTINILYNSLPKTFTWNNKNYSKVIITIVLKFNTIFKQHQRIFNLRISAKIF